MKLGIIVPYRDRPAHLKKFTQHTFDFLKQSNIEFEIVVVEQIDDKPFYRGKLLNVGYLKAKELGCNYVVFHDVDMLPIEAQNKLTWEMMMEASSKTEQIKKIVGRPR